MKIPEKAEKKIPHPYWPSSNASTATGRQTTKASAAMITAARSQDLFPRILSLSSLVSLAAVRHIHDEDDEYAVLYIADDAVVADPVTP